MRRREAAGLAEIPTGITRQQWQGFPGEESAHRQDAWEAAWRRWAAGHGLSVLELQEAISEEATGLLPGGHRVCLR